MPKNPILLLKKTGKFGLSTLFSMVLIIILFALVNIVIFAYALSNGFKTNKLLFNTIVVIIGFIFTIIAGYKMYRYNLMKGFSSIYNNITPLFEKISEFVIHKSEDLLNGKVNLKNNKNSKSINVKQILSDKYDKVPGFLKYGMTFIINRIPFVEMLVDLKQETDQNNKELASNKLHGKMDHFITKNVFGNNTKKWIFWLLPLNIVVQLVFIYLK